MQDLPQTEHVNPRTADLDSLSTADLVQLLIEEQQTAAESVVASRSLLADVVEEVARRMRGGGTLHYVGAGTSGRLGILDASEMPPTFGTDPSRVCGHIAGGALAMTGAVEGAEDDARSGEREMLNHVNARDAVVALSASGSAAYVIAALATARAIGAFTVSVTNVSDSALERAADVGIVLETGPEALTGSTRLKAGTAQKILLNTLSTAVMVRLEKAYGNLMVDVVATNKKLRERAIRLVRHIAGVGEEQATDLLQASNWNVKIAAVMASTNVDAVTAASLLVQNHGSLRRSLAHAPANDQTRS
jgi:N-acetylmuramic acid 6-phosphate etherase